MSDSNISPYQDSKGRFVKGNKASVGRSPGNPHAADAFRVRTVIVECISPDVLRENLLRLIEWSRDESLPVKDRRECVQILLDRRLGKPKETVEVIDDTSTPVVKLDNLTAQEIDTFLMLAEKAAQTPSEPPPTPLDPDIVIVR